jgi:hypothetical protein
LRPGALNQQRCVPALFATIVDECQCNAYCKAMPSTRMCGACGRHCRCACRHRRKLCITSCSAARRQLARRRQCDACGAGIGVAGAVWRLVGGAKSRVTVSAYSAPRLAEARQRPARAALGACCHRCVGGAHVLDDRFGRRRRLGRAVVRRSAPDARAGVARQHVALHNDARKRHCRTSSMRASSTRARWSIRSLICSPRTAAELEKERDARVAGALHTLTLLVGMPDIMLPTQRLQLLTMVCTHGAKFDRLQIAGASQRALFVARDILRLVHAPARQRRRSRRGDRPVFGRGAGGRRALALPHAGVGRADDVRAAARRRDRVGAERARRGALCEQRRSVRCGSCA